jgi:formylglycine-generating enzyme
MSFLQNAMAVVSLALVAGCGGAAHEGGAPNPQAAGDGAACAAPSSTRAALLAASLEAGPDTPAAAGVSVSADATRRDGPAGMVWIPAGEFDMGSTHTLARPDEQPVHRVRVDGFWMDATEVTNAQFAAFVEATGYLTVAERPIDWEELKKQLPPGTPKPHDSQLQPGSLVFTPPAHPVDLRQSHRWWTWTIDANWRRPEGPGSSLEGREDHPVVHVAHEDAAAYAAWAGKRLPTEAEWEFAARGGLERRANVWGDEPVDARRANTWQGLFPSHNTAEDGFARAAPVGSYPANGYGLYDMAGNVWEWCSDRYRPDTYARQVLVSGRGAVIANPAGPERSLDPRNPDAPDSRVQRGGSFLCNDSYCASYRPSARMAAPPDTGMQHLGFRCVMTPPPQPHDASSPNRSPEGQRGPAN